MIAHEYLESNAEMDTGEVSGNDIIVSGEDDDTNSGSEGSDIFV